MTVTTPLLRTRMRRVVPWVVILLVVLVVALVVAMGASSTDPRLMDPNSPTPSGSKAVAEVLRSHGVTVASTDSATATVEALSEGGTLLIYDRSQFASPELLRQVVDAADRVILVEPTRDMLSEIAPGVLRAGVADTAEDLDCTFGPASAAGTLTPGGFAYRIDPESPSDAVGCFASEDGVFRVVHLPGGTPVTVVGDAALFTNDAVAFAGNAAFVVGLTGGTEHLVWYLPGFADLDAGDPLPPTLAELTPPALSQVMTLAALVAIAAMVWRGRRFGPLVIENLPVVVPARETMEGRARLYQTSSARLRALDALRVGTIRRLSILCGLSARADVAEVVATCAALTGIPAAQLSAILVDTVPRSDADLVRCSDDLLTVERAVTAAVHSDFDPTPGIRGE